MTLDNLPKRESHKSKKTKLGRGIGSGHGGHTSTRGMKGQNSRTGGKVSVQFEGGQLPLVKRMPHKGGFTNPTTKKFIEIKTSQIEKLSKLGTITKLDLVENKIVKKIPSNYKVKVIFDEPIKSPVTVKGFYFTKSAKESFLKAGGNFK